jgi:hypothetical protein
VSRCRARAVCEIISRGTSTGTIYCVRFITTHRMLRLAYPRHEAGHVHADIGHLRDIGCVRVVPHHKTREVDIDRLEFFARDLRGVSAIDFFFA